MNEELKESIFETIKLIKRSEVDNNLDSYNPYKSVYLWTNEDIKNTLKHININNKEKALTVLSSGDHLFNLLVDGYKKVDTFDINKLSEYTSLGLKRAMILKYKLDEFKERIDKIKENDYTKEEELQEIRDCLNYMDEKHKIFFMEILNAAAKKKIIVGNNNRLLDHLIKKEPTTKTEKILGNNYLDNESNYELLRKRLNNTEITFTERNILELDNKKNNYDLIHLSNILDYAYIYWGTNWKYSNLKKVENNLKQELANDGVIILYYIFLNHDSIDYYFNNPSIKKIKCKKEHIITFNNIYNHNCGVLLTGKKLAKIRKM